MVRILLIQSRVEPARMERERDNFARVVGTSTELDSLNALDEALTQKTPDEILREYDGLIFGGSSDFDLHGGRDEKDPARKTARIILSRVQPLVTRALESGKPVLGVCFGHQLIAEIHGGEVQNDESQGKFGEHEVELTKEGSDNALFGSMPKKFSAQYQHKDSVTKLPRGATLMACAGSCRFSALCYNDTTYTVQFHPELRCQNPGCTKEHEPSEAATILQLWIERIVAA